MKFLVVCCSVVGMSPCGANNRPPKIARLPTLFFPRPVSSRHPGRLTFLSFLPFFLSSAFLSFQLSLVMLSTRALFFSLPALAQAQYQLTREHTGPSFFDRWQFYNNCTSRPLPTHPAPTPPWRSRQPHQRRRHLRLASRCAVRTARIRQQRRQRRHQGRQRLHRAVQPEAQHRAHRVHGHVRRRQPLGRRHDARALRLQVSTPAGDACA